MAYSDTLASAQMKGLINTSPKTTRSTSARRGSRWVSRTQDTAMFFDCMARTDIVASASMKGRTEVNTEDKHTKYVYPGILLKPNLSICSNHVLYLFAIEIIACSITIAIRHHHLDIMHIMRIFQNE